MKNQIESFGDARRLILDTLAGLRHGEIPVERGMAIAANMKVLNDNIQAEVNAVKVMMLATEKGHDFGRVVQMGKALLGESEPDQTPEPATPKQQQLRAIGRKK